MKFYGQANAVATKLIEAFKNGDVPKALAAIFINRKDDSPCRKWSWNNQLLTAIAGTTDARGFNQWKQVGRTVKKGSKCFHILAPIMRKFDDVDRNGKPCKVQKCIGFKSVPVFRYEDTEGESIEEPEVDAWMEALPLRDVADKWDLSVQTFNGEGAGYHGFYSYGEDDKGRAIALGVENLSTWLHELVHAADHKLGNLTKGRGQKWDNEMVAELGGATLLTMMGCEIEADWGGCWDYLVAYADGDKDKAISRVMKVMDRMCKAVELILETSDEFSEEQAA